MNYLHGKERIMMKITTMKVSPVAHLQWLSVKLLNIIRRKNRRKERAGIGSRLVNFIIL
jgi:hypothetical protein